MVVKYYTHSAGLNVITVGGGGQTLVQTFTIKCEEKKKSKFLNYHIQEEVSTKEYISLYYKTNYTKV